MGRRLHHLLALTCVLALAALVASGCGGDGRNLIPQQRAQELTNQLDALQAQIQAGQCDGLTTRVATFHDDATALPNSVDKRLRRRINDGVKSLQEHARSTCESVAARNAESQQSDTTPPDTETTDTTTTGTTTTETTPTTTTPTTTTPSETTPPTTVTPPDTGGGTEGPSDTTPGDTGSGDGISGGNGGTGDGGTG